MKRSSVDLLGVLLVLTIGWQAVVWGTGVQSFILPGPDKVISALWVNRVLIAENAWITGLEIVVGLLLGVLVGALTALHLMMSAAARRFLLPFLVFNQSVPVFAVAPVLTLWFGYGLESKVIITILIVYFPVTWTFYDGLKQIDPNLIDLARTMGAGRTRILLYLRIPSALPAFGSGLKLAAIYAPIGAVFGEWVGASKGLGYLMLYANGRAKIDLMFASLLILALFTVALHSLIALVADRMTFWSTRQTRNTEDLGVYD